jgi:uncharacterized protein (DUF1501 family)
MKMQRRDFIKAMGSSLLLFQSPIFAKSSALLQGKNNNLKPKLIWIVLRGAMDSLHTVVPTFDQQLSILRPRLLSTIKDDLLAIDDGYALHPSLKNLHQWYLNKQLIPIVAVSSGYQSRSHFDGQDFLESGMPNIDYDSGWLGRTIEVKNTQALAIARSTPISLRSTDKAATWYPSQLKDSNQDIYDALKRLYEYDPLLQSRLLEGLKVQNMLGNNEKSKKRQGKFADLTKACAHLMYAEQSIDCAMLELGGWDTHNNQANRLSRQLTELDNGLAILKTGLAEQWQNTVVIVATEFGRTARENGTAGTDHGTASAMFIAGGSIDGGRVLGQWPGLKNQQLFEQRDLQATSNTFSWIATILSEHWQLSDQQIQQVLPNIKRSKKKLLL